MVPLLTGLALGTVQKTPGLAIATVGAAVLWASQHYLSLAADVNIDRLYTLAHTLEILASFAFLYSTVHAFFKNVGNITASMAFMYVIMPFQQGLAVYFFLTANTPDSM